MKFIIICPAKSVTGGPELLHQLASALNDQGIEASICYYPFGSQSHITQAYKDYNTRAIDLPHNLQSYAVLASEYHTKVLKNLNASKKIVWWLSVDNYYRFKDRQLIKNFLRKILGPFLFRASLRNMVEFSHLSQSQYAVDFLIKQGLTSTYLGDYLNKDHKLASYNYNRKDWIAYNPSKSSHFVSDLSKQFPSLVFKPIVGLSPEGVNSLLQSCKIYLDFGRHPGKDRLPREAAIAGCCIITGTRGAAGNNVDIPIPHFYKFSDSKAYDNLKSVEELISKVFVSYGIMTADFDNYRSIIVDEYTKFQSEVLEIFGGYQNA